MLQKFVIEVSLSFPQNVYLLVNYMDNKYILIKMIGKDRVIE